MRCWRGRDERSRLSPLCSHVPPRCAAVVPAPAAGEVERLRKVGFGTLGGGTSFLLSGAPCLLCLT